MNGNRWDKISKRYTKSSSASSDEVKKLLGLNFTESIKSELNGDVKKKILDPALIMDLRHREIKSHHRSSSSSRYNMQKKLNMENIKAHNNFVDNRMIENELSKFKSEIRKLSLSSSMTLLRNMTSDDNEEIKNDEKSQLIENHEDSYEYDYNDNVSSSESSKIHKTKNENSDECSTSGSTSISEDSLEKIEMIKVSACPKMIYTDSFDIPEDNENFNEEENEEPKNFELCEMCGDGDQCEFYNRSYDSQSFYSLPNFNNTDVEQMIKISRFQSLVAIESENKNENEFIESEFDKPTIYTRSKNFHDEFEQTETNEMLIIKRMQIEEKNFQELVIMSNSHSKNINDDMEAFECERIIGDLFIDNQEQSFLGISDTERELLKKYFKDWLKKTTLSKILKTNSFTNEDRIKKINEFLNKVRIEQNKVVKGRKTKPEKKIVKSEGTSKSAKDYEHKLKVQQDIIELQKLKLKRQEQMITEMKLCKFSEMVKESKNELKTELLNVKRGNSKLKARVRCLQMISNIPQDPVEEEHRRLLAQGLVVPKFLAKMQERAQDRLIRHQEARLRRERLEQEKEEAKEAAELAKRLEDEEAKKKRLQEMREKRRQEKMEKQFREQERLRYQENMKMARDHYQRTLMKNLGFFAFKLIIRLKHLNRKKSMIHRQRVIVKRFFMVWFENAKIVWDNKRAQADRLHEKSVLRKVMKIWLHFRSIQNSKLLVAIDWYEVKISEKILKNWLSFTERCKIIENQKLIDADAHYTCQIKWQYFDCWRRYPALMKIERETEVRRQKWRMKVWDLLPDYKPQAD